MALATGTQAPDFSLKSKKGDQITDVKLSDNFGKKNTLLLFFPLAFTGKCTTEFCDISSGLGAYTDLDAEVLGVSVDSPFSQEAWAIKENISVTLASDLNKATAKAYDVLLDDLGGFGSASARAAFIIDKNGVIQYSEQTENPGVLPDFDAIRTRLAELK